MPDMTGTVVVVGGGTAGMEAAGQLAKAGLSVYSYREGKRNGRPFEGMVSSFP